MLCTLGVTVYAAYMQLSHNCIHISLVVSLLLLNNLKSYHIWSVIWFFSLHCWHFCTSMYIMLLSVILYLCTWTMLWCTAPVLLYVAHFSNMPSSQSVLLIMLLLFCLYSLWHYLTLHLYVRCDTSSDIFELSHLSLS